MNVLVINATKVPLKHEIIDFFVNKTIIDFVTIIQRNDKIVENYDFNINFESNLKEKYIFGDFSDTNNLFSIFNDVFASFQDPPLIIYIENIINFSQKDFMKLDILSFKNIMSTEAVTKTTVFQVLAFCLKKFNTIARIVVLVPPICQSKFFKGNIEETILISNLNMLTTSFADEFIDYKIYCNAVIEDENMFKTLDWLFLESQENIHGKLFSNKQIIDW